MEERKRRREEEEVDWQKYKRFKNQKYKIQAFENKTYIRYENALNINHVKCLSNSITGDEIAACSCPQGSTYKTLQTSGGEFALVPYLIMVATHLVDLQSIIMVETNSLF